MKNARSLLLAASTVALLVSACSQAPAGLDAPTLEPQFGTAEDDLGADVAVSSDGQVYALTNQGSGIADGRYQTLLRRHDSNGDLLWNKRIAALTCEFLFSPCYNITGRVLKIDARGNAYALVAETGDFQDFATYAAYDLYKHDADGKLVKKIDDVAFNIYGWDERADHQNALDMAVDDSGNIYLAYENSEFDYDSFEGLDYNLITKYSSSGVKQWQRTSTVGVPYGITVSDSGSVYVVGTEGVARYTNSGSLTWSKAANNSRGVRSGNIVISGSNLYTRSVRDIRKYDSSGKQLWLKTQGGLDTIVIQDMTGDTSGNLYLSGKYRVSTGNMSAFTRKLDPGGNILWTEAYGTPKYDDARGIATLDGSAIYTTGNTQGSLAHNNIGGRDGYLMRLSSSGKPIWAR